MIRSSFFGLNLGYKGVSAQQRALDVTGHNIANANTEGFSRQRSVMVTGQPMYSASGYVGSGVEVINVERVRDKFLDQQYKNEINNKGYWDLNFDVYSKIESILNEPRDSSLRTSMDEFWGSWQDLSINPESSAIRTTVIQKGITLTDNFNYLSDQMSLLKQDIGYNLESKVEDINSIADRIASLNLQIIRSESDGKMANDFRDRRDLLVEQLSKIVDIEVSEDQRGSANIFIGGQALVYINNTNKVENVPRADGMFDVKWDNGAKVLIKGGEIRSLLDSRDVTVTKYMGELDEVAKALAEFTNAFHETGFGLNGEDDTGIPFFVIRGESVGVLAKGEGDQVWPGLPATNGVEPIISAQTKGTELNNVTFRFENDDTLTEPTATWNDATDTLTLSGDWTDSEYSEGYLQNLINNALAEESPVGPGFDTKIFLNMRGATSADIVDNTQIELGDGEEPTADFTAKNIEVNSVVISDITKLAAASAPVTDPLNGEGDGSNSIRIAQIKNNNQALRGGSIDDYYRSMIGDIGINTSNSESMVRNQELLIRQISTQREQVMGVSLDEEMTHMIQFQQAYNASARFLTTVDDMLDILVNRLGRVGL